MAKRKKEFEFGDLSIWVINLQINPLEWMRQLNENLQNKNKENNIRVLGSLCDCG